MTASHSASFSTKIWAAVKSLSLFDTIQYLRPRRLLDPENGIPLFSANPESYNLKALYSILLLHRYSLQSFPSYISEASNIMLNSISLLDEPEYARFFLLLANRCIDLFERTLELPHLDLGIELLERFSAVQEPGTNVHLMVAMEHACACLQYSLTANVGEALDDARKIVSEACRASFASSWISAFGDIRTKVILADLIRNRIEMFVPEEDFMPIVRASLQLLNSLSPSHDLYTSLQVLMISVVLFLSQSADSKNFLGSLDTLNCILLGQSDLLSMHESLLLISNAISHCSIDRTICLIFMADVLDSGVAEPPRPLKDTNFQAIWGNEWESAQMFLQHCITGSQQGCHGIDGTSAPIFLKFKIYGDVLYRSSLLNVKEHDETPVGTHGCVFKLRMVPANASDCNTENSEGLTHYEFFEHLQGLCNTLPPDDLKYFSDHPSELDRLFKRSRRLENTPSAEVITVWKKSPGVIAYLLTQTGQSLTDRKKAAQRILEVDLECEPGYTQLLHRLVGYLRDYETDEAAVGMSSTLIKQFLGAQKRGTSMHFTGTVELATNYLMEFIGQPRRIALLALSVELFREAVESRGDESWFAEARKVVILGHILHKRLRYFADSEELLTQTIDHFITLWKTLPIGRPFSVSALDIIAVNALLYLSRNLEFEEWIEALKLLKAGLDLYINGLDDTESEGLNTAKNITSTLELVLDGGVNVGSSGLASKTLCLFHVSDMWRSIGLDICRNPGYLVLSAEMYRRSLHLQPGDNFQNEDNLRSCRLRDKEGLIQALIFLAQPNSVGTDSPRFGEVPISIFKYQATRPTKNNEPTSYSHTCVLRYHPTKVSYLPQVFEESAPFNPPSECSSTLGMPQIPAWPNDLMAPPSSSQSSLKTHSVTHSAIFPGIEKVLHNEGDEIFKMPLEPRTIKALMRCIEENVHTYESDFSYLSERVVHQSSQVVYMDPREVQLSTRIAKMKHGSSPYFARFAPLQALLSRGPERCLELIESSRTLFWTRLLRLQATFEGLPDDLARELEDTAHKLDSCKSQSMAYVSKEDMRWQFGLEANFSHLLSKARKIPGFENLLQPKGYEDLLQASVGGPVIVLMGTNSTYAALVITVKGVNSVFLPDLTSISLEKLTKGLKQANSLARGSFQLQVDTGETEEGRGTRPKGISVPFYESFLRGLWDLIVMPIFEFMGLLSSVRTCHFG